MAYVSSIHSNWKRICLIVVIVYIKMSERCHKYMLTLEEDIPDSGDSMNKCEGNMSQVYTHTGRGYP